MSTYVYVDGESHFERSAWLWRQLHGDGAALSHIVSDEPGVESDAFPDSTRPYVRLEPRVKFFWDTRHLFLAPRPFNRPGIGGAVYFTAFSGDDEDYHKMCVRIREQRFDPRVIRERADLCRQRKNRLYTEGIVEKAKGVDIELSARVLEDAYHNIYDRCYLFTSDIDFLPVICAVRRIGKKVVVLGYRDGLGARSKFEYVPDAFVDLSEHMRTYYQYNNPSIAHGVK